MTLEPLSRAVAITVPGVFPAAMLGSDAEQPERMGTMARLGVGVGAMAPAVGW